MSQTVLKAGTPENPFSKDVTIVHGPETITYHCWWCENTFTDTKDEARRKYLEHQRKAHKAKRPLIHSFEKEEADEYWVQNFA